MEVKAKSKRLADLRAYLEGERDRLQREIAAADTTAGHDQRTGYGNHMADDATDVFEQARNVGRQRDQQLLLGEVQDALQRMVEGRYGVCRRCGQPIDLARLRAQPTAALCLDCKTDSER